jgi:hypothetical protein
MKFMKRTSWITEKGNDTVMVEVKGLDKNLTRPHISQLDEHRGAREKPDDFPALLIANSFNRASSSKEKDQAISPNEIKKAVQTNVVLLKTLDLCNAYSLIEKGARTRCDYLVKRLFTRNLRFVLLPPVARALPDNVVD